MTRVLFTAVLVALIALWCMAGAAHAQLPPTVECPIENGYILAYFDQAGTQRSVDAGPVGNIVNMSIYGESNIAFVSGAQFAVEYGSNISWLADIPLYGAFIGTTKDGYSVGFGFNIPQFGTKFEIVRVLGVWTADCTAGQNVPGPRVIEHPLFPESCPLFSRFSDQAAFEVYGGRSQTCQMVELDIKPASCPNPFNINLFDWLGEDRLKKGGVLPVAILGSETVDVNDIDPASIILEGVMPLRYEYEDVGTLDGNDDCDCNDGEADGYMDMPLRFSKSAVAEALLMAGTPMVGQELALVLTGAYMDGMPFNASDCIMLVGNDKSKRGRLGLEGAAGLGFPTPNPFNPVTRISYSIPVTQHVRVAIYDVSGRMVEELVNQTKSAGEYVVEWDAGTMPSGVYFYRMQTGDRTIVRRATLLK